MDFFLAQQNLLLIAVALGSGLMLAWPAIQKNRAGAAISTSQAVTLMNQQHAVLIDIRPNDQFVAGHIPQARNLPANDIPQKVNSLPKNKPLIVVCDVGRSASVAAAQLRKLGFTDVSVLEGGLKAWNDAGLPVISKK